MRASGSCLVESNPLKIKDRFLMLKSAISTLSPIGHFHPPGAREGRYSIGSFSQPDAPGGSSTWTSRSKIAPARPPILAMEPVPPTVWSAMLRRSTLAFMRTLLSWMESWGCDKRVPCLGAFKRTFFFTLCSLHVWENCTNQLLKAIHVCTYHHIPK